MKQLGLILAIAFLFPGIASACAVCMGADDSAAREASNATLWALLALVGFIFTATGATAYFLWRKATSYKQTSHA